MLSVGAALQRDFANDDVVRRAGTFEQVVLRDPAVGGMYALWFTDPVSFGAGNNALQGVPQYSSFFHEMGHNVTLNSPTGFQYGGKIDGSANAIFSETMAQIYQHATAYELLNQAGAYGIPSDLAFDIQSSAVSSIQGVREHYDRYVSQGKHFASWNDPSTPDDETLDTFLTLAYQFCAQAEQRGTGYRVPLKRMMQLLQTFDDGLRGGYAPTTNSPTADAFRATLLVAAMSYGFDTDLQAEFRGLGFPLNDTVYTDLLSRVASKSTPTPTPTPSSTRTATLTSTGTPTVTLSNTPTLTATFVATGTPPPTVAPTGTFTATLTATTAPIATPTVTPTPYAVSGHGFTLQSGGAMTSATEVGARAALDRVLSWQPGTQTQSLLFRWSPESNFAVLGILPPGIANFRDTAPLSDPTYCYILFPFLGDIANNPDIRGISDFLCLYPGSNSASPQPGSFRVHLDETNTATLAWTAPGGQDRYVLTASRFDSSADRPIQLGEDKLSFSELIGNLTTCYRLVAFSGPTELGGTDRLCAVPGIADFSSGAPSSLAARLDRLRSAFGGGGR